MREPTPGGQNREAIFFSRHFLPLFTSHLSRTLLPYLGNNLVSTSISSRHNFYNYVLISFLRLFLRKVWEKVEKHLRPAFLVNLVFGVNAKGA